MTTPFNFLRMRCGLSQREAADFLESPLDTVKTWCAGRHAPRQSVIDEMRALYASIEHAADNALAAIRSRIKEHGRPRRLELSVATDDHEAQQLGLPCVGAHQALIGLIAARLDVPVTIVPRGSTVATASAEELRQQADWLLRGPP